MVDKLDDFVDALPANPKAIVSGDSAKAIASLKKARELNRKYRRSEMVDSMWEAAGLRAGQFSVSGRENAIRTEFRQLGLRLARNKNLRRLFTKEERDAIGKVANPGNLENNLRNLGKLAPKGTLPIFGGGMAVASDPGGLGLVAGGLFGLGSLSHLAASGLTNLNFGKARNAMLGLPPEMLPVVPYVNPMGASAATLPLRNQSP